MALKNLTILSKINSAILVFLLATTSSIAQNNICGEIVYQQTTNLAQRFSRDYSLSFDMSQALYEEILPNKKRETQEIIENNEDQQLNRTMSRNNLTSEFYYNNREEFYFMEVFFDKELYVKEDPFDWDWQLEEEVKMIGSFTCQKATTSFRGRNYTAWFTTNIPVPFGPWKFHGLSGLILEIYDSKAEFHIQAKNISIGEEGCEISMDIADLENKAMNIPTYLDMQDKLIDMDFARLSSKLPKGSATLKRDKNCEDCKNQRIESFDE